MALSDRQKKGVGYLVAAGLFGLAGGVLLLLKVTPTWVPLVLDGVVAVAAVLGIAVIAKPEV